MPGPSFGPMGSTPEPSPLAGDPGILRKMVMGLLDLPHRASQGEWVQPGAETMNYAGQLVGLGSMMPKPVNSLGIFGGVGAKTANLKMLETAQKMDAAGIDSSSIWGLTGWGKGRDGKWRFEINDQKSVMKPNTGAMEFPVGEGDRAAMSHPELTAAYPEMLNAMTFAYNPMLPARGTFYPPRRIEINPYTADTRSTMLHELQHAVQEYEGFGRGSNPSEHIGVANKYLEQSKRSVEAEKLIDQRLLHGRVSPEERSQLIQAKQMLTKFRDQINPKADPHTHYNRTSGEVESRNVQKRQDYTPTLRSAQPPWYTEDVPRSKQTVRYR